MELTLEQALQKGVEAHKAGHVQEADRLYTAILKAQPKHSDANHNMGVLAVGLGKVEQALPFLKTALESNPNTSQFWLSYIDALIKLERLADANAVLDQAKSKGAKGDGFDKLEQRLNVPSRVPVEAVVSGQKIEQVQQNILDTLKLDQAIKLAKKKAKGGSPEKAKRIYQDVLVKFPKNKRARDGLKELYGGTVAKISKAQEPPQDQVQSLINFYNQGHIKLTLEHATILLQKFPSSSVLYNICGATYKKLHQLDASVEAYNKALALKPDYDEAYYNMGNALKDQGKVEEAIEAYNKALAIKPDYAEAYYNIGIILKDQDKLEEAIEAYKKALAIKPDFAMGFLNIGNVLQEQSKLKEAIEAYNKALAIKPDFAEAYNNMGITLKDQGKLEEAIEAYNKALAIKPDFAEAYQNIGDALTMVAFKKPIPGLQKIIISLLDKKSFVRPKDIAYAAISLLKFEPDLKRNLHAFSVTKVGLEALEVITDLSKLPLLLKLMSVCPIPDLDLENLLRNLRASLLLSISDLTGFPEVLKFQSTLALQCFTNEYIYNQSEDEEKALAYLERSVSRALSNGGQPSPQSILCLASYKPLNQYEWFNSLLLTNEIEDVFTRQVVEPNQEAEFKSTLPVLEDITNEVSSKVRDQYEASPYPRWVNLGLSLKPAPISKVLEGIKLKLFDDDIIDIQSPNILIAGCGTGQHSLGTAARFKDSKVLAIDLSLSSLSYAKRKTEELGIENINYMQADILDLSKLDRQFDIVESGGVLHHMDDPVAGWRVLTDCLKPGGLMKIGLYSELARQNIVQIRQEISKAGIGSGVAAIKSFRTTVMKSDQKQILNSQDFYSLSNLKDMLFHVQEQRFTIPQIQDCLSELGLKFCGFEAEKATSHFKLTNTNTDDPYDLDKWHTYEEANPSAFAEMYQFWCQKIA
jgi:tetratricopeptide (TPR) repeat protein/2-polyprenyl-3-methyl-5-hydroxy-6-metoxy-1,4-benzoquinol methylase